MQIRVSTPRLLQFVLDTPSCLQPWPVHVQSCTHAALMLGLMPGVFGKRALSMLQLCQPRNLLREWPRETQRSCRTWLLGYAALQRPWEHIFLGPWPTQLLPWVEMWPMW